LLDSLLQEIQRMLVSLLVVLGCGLSQAAQYSNKVDKSYSRISTEDNGDTVGKIFVDLPAESYYRLQFRFRATPDSYRPPSTNLVNYAPRKSVKIAEKPSKGTEEDEVPVEGYAGDVAEDVEDSAPVPQEEIVAEEIRPLSLSYKLVKKAKDKPTYFYPTFNSQPSTPKPIQSFSPQPTPQPTTPQPIQTYSPTPTLSPIKDQTPQPSPAPLSPQPTSNVSPTPYSPQPSFTYSPRPSPQPTTTYSPQKSEVPTPITTIIYSLKPSSSAQPSYNQLDSQPSRKYSYKLSSAPTYPQPSEIKQLSPTPSYPAPTKTKQSSPPTYPATTSTKLSSSATTNTKLTYPQPAEINPVEARPINNYFSKPTQQPIRRYSFRIIDPQLQNEVSVEDVVAEDNEIDLTGSPYQQTSGFRAPRFRRRPFTRFARRVVPYYRFGTKVPSSDRSTTQQL